MTQFNRSRLFLAIFLTATVLNARADDGNRKLFVVYDRGQDTCGQFIEARRINQQESFIYSVWLAGYITAYNHLKADTTDILNLRNNDPAPMAGPMVWIEKYCQDHPMNLFVAAALEFTDYQYLKRKK